MSLIDWMVLALTLAFIVIYGAWKTSASRTMQDYLLGGRQDRWFAVAISIVATQASAVTFLSAPGQAYTDGMRFVQFYFGLPIAMIVIAAFFVPFYHRLNVFTAYEFLEKRFDLRVRTLAAGLFLIQRGLAAGFTIFAPALILSALLGWDLYLTNLVSGGLVVIYTVSGGSKAVSLTQKHQMAVILTGMVVAAFVLLAQLPKGVSGTDALHLAGRMQKLNALTFNVDWRDKYTIWTGLLGGFFLSLSYFGTDQSQVQRYLSGSSVSQSKLGLLLNGMVKIPMQFGILLVGALVYVFYLFAAPPLFFNPVIDGKMSSDPTYATAKQAHQEALAIRRDQALRFVEARHSGDLRAAQQAVAGMQSAEQAVAAARKEAKAAIGQALPAADTNDTNFIFLTFVKDYMPVGLVGLLVAVIFCASMSSTSSELSALASTTVVDIYRRFVKSDADDRHYLAASRWFTAFWGVVAIVFSMFANRLGTLIEAVNVLGSLVYGTILGIFVVAFLMKKVKGTAVLLAAVLAEALVLLCYIYTDIPFLWYNPIGCLTVCMLAGLFSMGQRPEASMSATQAGRS